jgi:predicted phage baseplate assembly protein
MALRNRPVLAPQPPGIETGAGGESPAAIQPLDLAVVEAGVTAAWTRVNDFASSGPQDTHYVLNRTTGQILFGDGIHGRIPIAGQANVIARSYRYGGGTIGNVGKETVKNLNFPIEHIAGVSNVEAADGGADEESLTDAKLRIPKDLKAIDRAVTLEDYAHLAQLTPGAQIERAVAYLPEPTDDRPHPPITVVVLPQSQATNPTPSEATKRRVCRYLNDRRLVTTRLTVTGPEYLAIDVTIDVRVREDVGLKETSEQIERDLTAFFSPIALDDIDQPWPFGGTVYYSEVLAQVMAVAGVRFVAKLSIIAEHGQFTTQQAATDHKAELETARGTAEGLPPLEVVPVAVAAASIMSDPTTAYAVQATYDCVDIPLTPRQLVHLRKTTITVDYARGRSG